MTLNARQQRFVVEYPKDMSATQAAVRAGYSPKTAYSQGQRLLKHVEVATALEKRALVIAERAEVQVVDVIRESARIAFADIRDVVRWTDDAVFLVPSDELTSAQAAAIREVKVTRTIIRSKDGSETEREVREVKMHGKDASLDRLARMFPEFTNRHQIEGVIGHFTLELGRGDG